MQKIRQLAVAAALTASLAAGPAPTASAHGIWLSLIHI